MPDYDQVTKIQEQLTLLGIEAWALYSFRDANPIACELLGVSAETHVSRRWMTLIPADGPPISLVHRIEPHLATILPGSTEWYMSLEEYEAKLSLMLGGIKTVAMEYSSRNAIPVVAWVDAGTVELVESCGPSVVSSGELVSRIRGHLSPEELAAAVSAGATCRRIMHDAFGHIRREVLADREIREYDVVSYIESRLADEGLITPYPPICSVDANSADAHYQASHESSAVISRGSFVLIDLWGRDPGAHGVFGDITWTAFVGADVPDRIATVFGHVRDAREAALQVVVDRFERGEVVSGADADRAARTVIEEAGFGSFFVHRTGHSITGNLHGSGTNLDSFETIDSRPLLPSSSFSIEPGIYLPGEFGIRSEIDVVITPTGEVITTSAPAQRDVIALLR